MGGRREHGVGEQRAPRAALRAPVRERVDGPHAAVLRLQRTAGNAAVAGLLQRKVNNLVVPPSPAGTKLIGKTTFGKIKAAVTEYNALAGNGAAELRAQVAKLQAIDVLIAGWNAGHANDTDVPAVTKRNELAILSQETQDELTAVRAQLAPLEEAEAQKAAFDNAVYMPQYSGPDYTGAGTPVMLRWLASPELGPILRHFIKAPPQADSPTIDAWDDLSRWDGSRGEALAIYDRYHMGTADDLNITGEGPNVGGVQAINAFRAAIGNLRAAPAAAPPADIFRPITTSLSNVLTEIFNGAFKQSPVFARVTRAPAP